MLGCLQGLRTNARFWSNIMGTAVRSMVTPGTYESRKAFLVDTEQGNRVSAGLDAYDQVRTLTDCSNERYKHLRKIMSVNTEIDAP